MKAVRSMDTSGTISTSCSDAMSSNSAGVIEVLSEGGRAISLDLLVITFSYKWSVCRWLRKCDESGGGKRLQSATRDDAFMLRRGHVR